MQATSQPQGAAHLLLLQLLAQRCLSCRRCLGAGRRRRRWGRWPGQVAGCYALCYRHECGGGCMRHLECRHAQERCRYRCSACTGRRRGRRQGRPCCACWAVWRARSQRARLELRSMRCPWPRWRAEPGRRRRRGACMQRMRRRRLRWATRCAAGCCVRDRQRRCRVTAARAACTLSSDLSVGGCAAAAAVGACELWPLCRAALLRVCLQLGRLLQSGCTAGGRGVGGCLRWSARVLEMEAEACSRRR